MESMTEVELSWCWHMYSLLSGFRYVTIQISGKLRVARSCGTVYYVVHGVSTDHLSLWQT